MYARELSFTSVTHWFTNDGSIMRSDCGSTMWRSVPQRVSPSDRPAAHCPAAIPVMPANTAWAKYAPPISDKAAITDNTPGTLMPSAIGSRK